MSELFYQDVLPEGGQHVVATLRGKQLQHYVVSSRDDIVPFLSAHEDKNTYHSLGAYTGLGEGPIDKVKNLAGCIGAKAFTFDLDVGSGKGKYLSLELAAEAMFEAHAKGYIPEPRWALFSGGGFQLTYVLPEVLPEAAWLARFRQFRQHMLQHLKVDRTVGTAPYRLLRSPCTRNWKYRPPVQPVLLSETPGEYLDLDWLDTLPPAPARRLSEGGARPDDKDVSLSCDNPVKAKTLVKACRMFHVEAREQGANSPEPKWLGIANLCAHTVEYRKLFHLVSKGHTGYVEAEADAKFDHVVRNAAHGPMGCEAFGDATDPESPCHGCWARKAGLPNPISAARNFLSLPLGHIGLKSAPSQPLPVEEVVSLDEVSEEGKQSEKERPPFNPEGLSDNVVVTWQHIGDEDGDICDYVWLKPVAKSIHGERAELPYSTDAGRTWHAIPSELASSPATLSKAFYAVGVAIYDEKRFHAYVKEGCYFRGERGRTSDRYGWLEDHVTAMLPTGCMGESEVLPGAALSSKLHRSWGGQAGSAEEWCEAVSLYGEPGQEPYLYALLASLASPLMSWLSLERGLILCLTGAGGVGKTSALKAAASVWGRPISTHTTMASTMNATRKYLAACGHLPMLMDEVTQMESGALKQFALEISQGKGRERATKEGGLAESEEWHLTCLTTSNTSLYERLVDNADEGTAEMNRVVEVVVPATARELAPRGQLMLDLIEGNHGHAGPALMAWLLEQDRHSEVRKVKETLRQLRAKDRLKGSDRFADNLVVACYYAHRRIKRTMPAFPGDPEKMFMWMRQQLQVNRNYVQTILTARIPSIDDFIMEFSAENLLLKEMGDRGYNAQGTSVKGYAYERGDWVVVPKGTIDLWARRYSLQSRTVLNEWARTGRLRRMGGTDQQPRWSGRTDSALLVDGSKQYPAVVMLLRNKQAVGEGGKVVPLKERAQA